MLMRRIIKMMMMEMLMIMVIMRIRLMIMTILIGPKSPVGSFLVHHGDNLIIIYLVPEI